MADIDPAQKRTRATVSCSLASHVSADSTTEPSVTRAL